MAGTRTASEALTIHIGNKPRAISPDLLGIFFEDLNYAADGGLYAELIQNRSFEYQATEQRAWNNASFWEPIARGGGRGDFAIDAALCVHENNAHYAVLHVESPGDGVGLLNGGYDGIAVKAGEQYDASLFARQLYMNDRWGPGSAITGPMPLVLRLESKSGEVLGETSLQVSGNRWHRLAGTISASRNDPAAVFVILARARGGIAVDEISLFPRKTFRGRANGLRDDLARTIADLRPRFIRFPGGCLVHGSGLGNMYRWKDTIGPIEQRKGQSNLWGYHQSVGLGYYEYFQFCEDIVAKPLPVVAAAVSCQNSGHTSGVGQQCLPMEQMPAFIQDVLDLIEWANGPVTSTWGAKRAAAGHPEPFHLEYLGVGNEDHITPGFRQRFEMIYKAIKQKHPEITIIGTVGPFHAGSDYDEGWKIADELHLEVVDEHYYEKPEWFWENLRRYDRYDRARSAVYLGEYAAHDAGRKSTLRSALAEAAYLTHLERNGDVVKMASYAPLLGKWNHTQWMPDLIYFDNTTVTPTINYYVQQLFGINAGDASLPVMLEDPSADADLAISCVCANQNRDVILKIVSRSEAPRELRLDLRELGIANQDATCTVLSGDPQAQNAFGQPPKVLPSTTTVRAAGVFEYVAPAHSLSVIRLSRGG